MINFYCCCMIVGLYLAQYNVGSAHAYFRAKYNLDESLEPLQIIRRYGYPAESYTVETEDGYLLTLHRIPGSKYGKKGGQPILIQHGILLSSADFVTEGNASLGFILADQGYDVWLGNSRGNYFSIGHKTLKTDSKEFWDFSWHEMAIYDLPAVIGFISKTTGRGGEILYIGHSMGTTMFYIFASMKPQSAKQVQFMVSLAPVAYLGHVRTPVLRLLGPIFKEVMWAANLIGIRQLFPRDTVTKSLTSLCKYKGGSFICERLFFIFFGPDKEGYNKNIMPVIFSHLPAGTSAKAVYHYGQGQTSGGAFRQYDHGSKKNLALYGTKTPPSYDLKNIRVPIYLMYAEGDYLSGVKDVEYLSTQLGNLAGMYLLPSKHFNHVDYMYRKDAPTLVYKPLIELFKPNQNNYG